MPAVQMQIIHYPNLKTVLMIERVIERSDGPISRNEIKKRLPKKVMHQTLNLALDYLEKSGKILIGSKGILWVFNENPSFRQLLKNSKEI